MRHHDKVKSLNRPRNQRAALMRSLNNALVTEERIITTTAKAKALRPFAEKLVTKGKGGYSLATLRHLISRTGSEAAAQKLIKEIAPRYEDRNGGYTRIVKLPPRESDGADMAVIEFV